MTEDKKHLLDEISISDIISYLNVRVSEMAERIRRTEKAGLTLPKDILGLWEQTVCEIRSEIRSWDLKGPHTKQYATELCDKLEHSMCALASGPYKLNYSIGD